MSAVVRLVEVTRGSRVECEHYGSVAVVSTDGRLLASCGDPHALVFARSTLKPFQAQPLLASGAADAYGFGDEEIALCCASHAGEPIHTGCIAAMLTRIGCSERDLQCGCHLPHSAVRAPEHGVPPLSAFTSLHHNCSGKHTGFLACCRHLGFDTATYLNPQHPVQRMVRATIAHAAGVDAATLDPAIDGCGAPTYALPLSALACAYARLAAADAALEPHLLRTFRAMTVHPLLVSGSGRSDEFFMRAAGGDMVAKIGADGVQAFGIRSRGIGIALKIADGNTRAACVAAAAVLHQLGWLGNCDAEELEIWMTPLIRNARGTVTGEVWPVVSLNAN